MSRRHLTVSLPERTAKKLDESRLEREWRALYEDEAPTAADREKADALFAELVRPRRRRRG